MGIPILGKDDLYIETGLGLQTATCLSASTGKDNMFRCMTVGCSWDSRRSHSQDKTINLGFMLQGTNSVLAVLPRVTSWEETTESMSIANGSLKTIKYIQGSVWKKNSPKVQHLLIMEIVYYIVIYGSYINSPFQSLSVLYCWQDFLSMKWLTHCSWVMHICVRKLSHYWFR